MRDSGLLSLIKTVKTISVYWSIIRYKYLAKQNCGMLFWQYTGRNLITKIIN